MHATGIDCPPVLAFGDSDSAGMNESAVCGIDVAFAKNKPLPVCVCVWRGSVLEPLPLRGHGVPIPPRGTGNRAALDDASVAAFADAAVTYLRTVERLFGISIRRVAIDAPRDYASEGQRRQCELALDSLRISCFATPSHQQFAEIRRVVRAYLAQGGPEAAMPYANKLWMLVGFALFRRLETEFECLEVFPNAIVRALAPAGEHKSTKVGFERQVALLSNAAGWPQPKTSVSLNQICYGLRHDKLDAFMAAWVASLPRERLLGHGDGGRDTIWVPALG